MSCTLWSENHASLTKLKPVNHVFICVQEENSISFSKHIQIFPIDYSVIFTGIKFLSK